MSILVATDLSEPSTTAVRAAARLARSRERPLTVLYCAEGAVDDPPWGHLFDMPAEMLEEIEAEATERLRTFVEETLADGERPEELGLSVELERPTPGILAAVDRTVEVVVLGATGRGRVANYLLGSTAEEVIRGSDRPVMVVPQDATVGPFQRLLAPVDFTHCSERSLELAARLARSDGASLDILHSFRPPTGMHDGWTFEPEMLETYDEQVEQRFASFVAEADLGGLETERFLVLDTPVGAISDLVDDRGTDLVVMGTHGRSGLGRFFLGSTANKVLRRMPCPVVTVRTRDDEPSEEAVGVRETRD